MASLLAVERFVPEYRYDQSVVAAWVRDWLRENGGAPAARLLPVYESAGVRTRGSAVPIEEVFRPGDLQAQSDRYAAIARTAAVDLARRALAAADLPPSQVDLIVSVSCTGVMIPAVDAYVADALGMGPRLARLPITESGCAGGVVGLARALDFLAAHPDRTAIVLALELASLTFQRGDTSATNVVSTAIFGDGGAAVVLVGADHPRARSGRARLLAAESVFFPGTTHLMGFHLRNSGLHILLDKELAPFVRRQVAGGVDAFLAGQGLKRSDITRWILHPGGRRIIEVMAERLELADGDLAPTEAVLSEHGNMSSVTVLFVLDEILRRHAPRAGERGLLGAFGPGFGAEFALLEFALIDLARRSTEGEMLDEGVPDDEALRSLGDLRFVDRWLGNRAALAASVLPFLDGVLRPRILDVGCGSGDVLSALRRAAGGGALAVGVDLKPLHLTIAPADIVRVVGDARRLPFAPRSFDVVTASLFLHHFDAPELPDVLRGLYAVARRALVVNDLRRARVPYVFGRAFFRMLFRSPVSVADGLVSIRRAFLPGELAEAFTAAGIPGARIRRTFPYRLIAVAERPPGP